MLPGGSHQRRQPKHNDAAAAPSEKLDEPASKYARMQWFLITWLVCDNVLLTFGSLGKKSSRAAFFHAEMLVFPISISLNTLYVSARWIRWPSAPARLLFGSFSGSTRPFLHPQRCGRAENRSFGD